MYMYPHWKPLHPLCSWSGYGPDSIMRHISTALSLLPVLDLTITLVTFQFNINLLSSPTSQKQYFIQHALTKTSHVFAVNTPTCICPASSSEFHKYCHRTPVTAQSPIWWNASLLLHAQYVTRSHILPSFSFSFFFFRRAWRLGKTITRRTPQTIATSCILFLSAGTGCTEDTSLSDESANVKVKQKTLQDGTGKAVIYSVVYKN